jgi:hypothetical protein
VIRLALVALAAAGAVWLSDDLIRIWSSDGVARRTLDVQRWLKERGNAHEVRLARPTASRAEAPEEAARVESPPEFVRDAPHPNPSAPSPSPDLPAPAAPAAAAAPPEPAVADAEERAPPADRLSRAQADRVRWRLDRVMELAGRSGR